LAEFDFRGYEIHSSRMWQQAHIDMALDFMSKHGLNALILHQNDLQDQIVFPDKYFDNDIMWERWPVRRQGVLYRRDYMSEVVRKAKSLGIKVYFEIKEVYFCDNIFEMVPGLLNSDGSCCPTNPFWLEFLDVKMTELFERLPDLAGIIVSLGTRESMISMAANRCTCERCKNTDPFDWYVDILKAIHKPLADKGKDLIVRDFSYTRDHQNMIIDACMKVSKDIIVSLKCQPHDYFPTFPMNPEIGRSNLREYIEVDVWGQFAGMGVIPSSLVEMLRDWLTELKRRGVPGVWFRTDWELMHEASVHNSLCMVNLYAAAMLSENLNTELDDIYRTWVETGLYNPMISGSYIQSPVKAENPEAYKKLKDFTKAAWKVYEKSGYIRGLQYLESDQPPFSLFKIFDIMVNIFNREEWVPGSSASVAATVENIPAIFAEKEEGVKLAKELYGILDVESLGVPVEFARDLTNMIDTIVLFAECCRAITIVAYKTQMAINSRRASDKELAEQSLVLLDESRDNIKAKMDNVFYPYYIHSRLHPIRMDIFKEHIRGLLNGIQVVG